VRRAREDGAICSPPRRDWLRRITVNLRSRDAYTQAGLYSRAFRDTTARAHAGVGVERIAKARSRIRPGTVLGIHMAVDLLGRVVEAASGKRRRTLSTSVCSRP